MDVSGEIERGCSGEYGLVVRVAFCSDCAARFLCRLISWAVVVVPPSGLEESPISLAAAPTKR